MNKELLTELFKSDENFIGKFHNLSPATAEICAEKTFNDLSQYCVDFHLLKQNQEVIGYYGIERKEGLSYLTGFFLKPNYRTKEVITKFWNEVDSHFNTDYFIGVFAKNTPAIEFLSKKTTTKYEIDNTVLFRVGR